MHLNGTQEHTVRALIEQELKREKSIGCFFYIEWRGFFSLFFPKGDFLLEMQ